MTATHQPLLLPLMLPLLLLLLLQEQPCSLQCLHSRRQHRDNSPSCHISTRDRNSRRALCLLQQRLCCCPGLLQTCKASAWAMACRTTARGSSSTGPHNTAATAATGKVKQRKRACGCVCMGGGRVVAFLSCPEHFQLAVRCV